MTSIEFVCPHCSGRFELENPPAGGRVACPSCKGMLAIPAELPQPDTDEGAFDFVGERAPRELLVHRRTSAAQQEAPIVEPLSRAEKEHRRQIRSLAWMIGGGALLAIAAAVLSRL